MSYLVIKVYSVECDRCDEVASDYVPGPLDRHPLRSTRREIAKEGWMFDGARDLCPLHAVTSPVSS